LSAGIIKIIARSSDALVLLIYDLLEEKGQQLQPGPAEYGGVAYNLLHMIRQFYVWGEEVKRSMDWLIKRLDKVGAKV
jgi:hypothetical protein